MALKIFHTADVHLGLKFSSYPEDLAKRLCEARFETLERMVKFANEERCDLFVVSGDLFDHLRVSQRDILRAAKILGGFERVAVVLPGNHDYYTGQEDDIWNVFRSAQQNRVEVLSECKPYPLHTSDLDVCLYPAPCTTKHSKSHALGWISSKVRGEATYHIGIAHGSFEGLTPDTEGEYYPMRREDLQKCNLDLWLMGHVHVQFPPRVGGVEKVFYPATPEPDGFDCRHEGKAWILELNEKKVVEAKSVSTGQYRFEHSTVEIRELSALEEFRIRYEDGTAKHTLLKLFLKGSLRKSDHSQVGSIVEDLKQHFLFLKPDTSALTVELARDDIDREFPRDSFPHRLLTELAHEQGQEEALQAAYELIQEVRSRA